MTPPGYFIFEKNLANLCMLEHYNISQKTDTVALALWARIHVPLLNLGEIREHLF